MWDGFNKRKFPRVHLRCELTVNPQGQEKSFRGFTENVGTGGVAMILQEPLERFSECHIHLEIEKDQNPVECRGKIVWVVPSRDLLSSDKSFDTGIEFTEIKENFRLRLSQFLEKNQQSQQNQS